MKTETKIIGPFLGPRGAKGVEIFIALPEYSIETLECHLFQNETEIEKSICSIKADDLYRLFSFKFGDLEDNTLYHYKFTSKGEAFDLEAGLVEEDCAFQVLGESTENKSFILMSCHNPFQKEKGSADEGWAVWTQLCDHLRKDKSIRLLVLGGDQVYNDEVEKKHINSLRKDAPLAEKALKESFIKNYQEYWGHSSYRKALASTLSVAMWDDHDITDGWGSRPESFNKKAEFKENWWKFFEIAAECFQSYQASRNPEPIHKFSSILDWGDQRFILADFRSERNLRKKQIWTKEHKTKVFQKLQDTPDNIKKIFFLSPVVAFRTNFSGDKRLSFISKILFKFKRHVQKDKPRYIIQSWKKYLFFSTICFLLPAIVSFFICNTCEITTPGVFSLSIAYSYIVIIAPTVGVLLSLWVLISRLPLLMTKIPELPDLSDDIEDGLSSDSNMKTLKEIMDCLVILARKGKDIYILSGDIHIAGLTEIIDTREKPEVQVLQIVSSPIAYKPMPKVVEGMTTTSSEMVLREADDSKRLFARNIFYISKRNFAQIFPDKKDSVVAFHFEGHKLPTVFPKEFFRQ